MFKVVFQANTNMQALVTCLLLAAEHKLKMEVVLPAGGLKCPRVLLVWPGKSAVLKYMCALEVPEGCFLLWRKQFSFASTSNNFPQARPWRHTPAFIRLQAQGWLRAAPSRVLLCFKTYGPTESVFRLIWLSRQTLYSWRASGVINPGMVGTCPKRIFYTDKEFLLDGLNSIPG